MSESNKTKCICVYEVESFVFDKTREEFEEAIKDELRYGAVDTLQWFMDEYDKRQRRSTPTILPVKVD